MLDFLRILVERTNKGEIKITPDFDVIKSEDLMTNGKFYAIWVEDKGSWSTDEFEAIRLIDRELDIFANEYKKNHPEDTRVKVCHLKHASTGSIDRWKKYCKDQALRNYHNLNEKLVFANTPTEKNNYASIRLTYPLEVCDISAYEKLISTLYSPEERRKLEWAIGAVVTGDSKKLQKFIVLYGAAGTGKSTILNIIQKLFKGYCAVFDSKALGSSNAQFALESFRDNPLIGIQHDGDLSHIEDNTRLNSLVSHEEMLLNVKYQSAVPTAFNAFLFMGTNKPVKITDAKSGILRRLIDVSPSGKKLSGREYTELMSQIDFELGGIAKHCESVYLENPHAFDNYVPISMMSATNDFFNFVLDSYSAFEKEDGTTLQIAWEMYKTYCDDAKVRLPYSRRVFQEELKNYFREYKDRSRDANGFRVRCIYSGFRTEKFEVEAEDISPPIVLNDSWLRFNQSISLFDVLCADCPAQYASTEGTPMAPWSRVDKKLSDILTSRLHYVRVPENHIVIDFDIPDENGEKSLERNLLAASEWKPTYAELSKSGKGIHLHYIYTGDVSKLSRIYGEHIEIKVFTGKSSLRRMVTKCNDIPIATIGGGLPLKGEKIVNIDIVKNESMIRTMIMRNLNKEYHAYTAPSIDFINKILDDAYESGVPYDVTDMRNAIIGFANSSHNQADKCLRVVSQMKFKSKESGEPSGNDKDEDLIFYDVEVFPNFFLVCWKYRGKDKKVVRMYNPTPRQIEELMRHKLVGFNCRRYDNHMIYACMIGYDNEQLYKLSKSIVGGEPNCFFGEAYNISHTDIYDFAAAGNKMSLKKLEILMKIRHKELNLPWDEPVPKEKWGMVADYCENDVLATEAAFDFLSADWIARQILSDLAGMTANDTTNSLTTRIIFGRNRNPQNEFNYRDLSKPVTYIPDDMREFLTKACPEMMAQPFVGTEGESILPYFPGYSYKAGVSTYRGEEVGEGGYVYAEPGCYGNVALLDISSMHPHSTIAEVLFGVRYTKAYQDIVEGRVSIKHEAWNEVDNMLDGKLRPYIQKVKDGIITSKQLADALKTAINSVYGLTSAKFTNPFRDKRNIDNIVAKRGALFMIDLKHEVQKRGFTVAHIKTDSIKIPDATPEIIQFVMDFGKRYGYSFEHEATYERMCLVNNAVYIAKYKDGKHAGEWTATGTEFAIPYVFKTLFTKESIEFDDLCETFQVTKGDLYLDMNEDIPQMSPMDRKEFERLEKLLDGIHLEQLEKYMKRTKLSKEEVEQRYSYLKQEEAKTHNYVFVGRVGQFTPVVEGVGGGVLYRMSDGKAYAASGSTGYRWLESVIVQDLHLEDKIDLGYYKALADTAAMDIIAHCDLDWFVSDDPYIGPKFIEENGFRHPVYTEEISINDISKEN